MKQLTAQGQADLASLIFNNLMAGQNNIQPAAKHYLKQEIKKIIISSNQSGELFKTQKDYAEKLNEILDKESIEV